jgi:hypothetical protein
MCVMSWNCVSVCRRQQAFCQRSVPHYGRLCYDLSSPRLDPCVVNKSGVWCAWRSFFLLLAYIALRAILVAFTLKHCSCCAPVGL